MKNLKILVCIAILFAVIPTAKAQWVVTDRSYEFGSRNSQFSETDYTDFEHCD